MVTIENFEEYLMLAADGELDATGQAALDKFIRMHPNLTAEVEAWQSLRLQPDASVKYENKEALLKKEPKRIAISWKPVTLAAAAALATMLIAIPALWPDTEQGISGEILIPHITIPTAVSPAVKDTSASYIAALPVPEPLIPRTNILKKTRKKPTVLQTRANHQNMRSTTAIAALDVATIQQLPEGRPIVPAMQVVEVEVPVPVLTDRVAQASKSGTGMPSIHFAAANQPAVAMLKEGIEQRVAQVASVAQAVRNTDLIVKIGHSSIKLN